LDLDPGARKIVDTAHALSQLRGVCQIPSRLMLVAFLLDDSSEAVQLCEGEGVHIQSLIAVLLAATGGDTPQMFELGDFACSRIVKPTVIRARQLVDKAAMVREADLFRAFCEVAPQEFKHLMKVLPKPWQIDLDSLYGKTELDDQPRQPPEVLADSQADISPGSKDGVALGIDTESVNIRREQFEPAAWRVILLAANWSLLQRSPQLRSPHLFAALIGDGSGPVGIMLRRANLNPEVGKILVLMMIPPPQQTTEISKVYIGQNAAQVMLGAITAAQKHGRSKANVDDLIQSLLANGGGSVGEYLRKLGVDIRPWWYSFGGNGHNGNGRER
jgi:hypothetical protein